MNSDRRFAPRNAGHGQIISISGAPCVVDNWSSTGVLVAAPSAWQTVFKPGNAVKVGFGDEIKSAHVVASRGRGRFAVSFDGDPVEPEVFDGLMSWSDR